MTADKLFHAQRFFVERVKRECGDGKTIQKEIVRHPGSVVILPILNDNQVCLIRNFRLAVNQPLLELPAGTLEPGEAPLHCAERELIEETGYTAGKLEALTSFLAAPGILDERMHMFLATDLVAGQPDREADEEIENVIMPFEETLELIRTGAIEDAKTIVGLFWYQQFC